MDRKPPTATRALATALSFIVLLAAAGFLWRSPLILAAVYAATGLFLLLTRWSAAALAYYLVGFFLGPLAEYVAVKYGAWTYSNAPLTLPLWLPFGWGMAAVMLKSVGDWLSLVLGRTFRREG